jgi:enamine deaminase RidA (YjgF/YER057c/UK114 family)
MRAGWRSVQPQSSSVPRNIREPSPTQVSSDSVQGMHGHDEYTRPMGRIENRLAERSLSLPQPLLPQGNYLPVTVHDGLAYVSGHGPFDGGRILMQGRIGDDLSLEQGYRAARLTALSIMASLKQELEDLDRISRWIRAVGYIHCTHRFDRNADVLNGFSDLVLDIWGDAGRHARSAPGQGPAPLNLPVIVDAIVAVTDP